jgi:hypothetical protein
MRRIPTIYAACVAFMKRTNNRQLEIITPPSTLRYTIYGWKPAESTQWTTFYNDLQALFDLYSNPDSTGHGVIAKLKAKIAEIIAYDSDKINGHHLLDKVAAMGDIDDFICFNVVHGTILAHDPVHHDYSTVSLIPSVSLKEEKLGYHLIAVENPETPDSVAIPEGLEAALVYMAIGAEAPKSFKDFDCIGKATFGTIESTFPDLQYNPDKRIFAFYYAAFVNIKLVQGPPSNVLKVEIRLPEIPL